MKREASFPLFFLPHPQNRWVDSGSTITNTYDEAGQKETVTYRAAGGSPAAAIGYSYYPDGEIKTLSDGFSSITNSYDA
ncbi:MAG: hypothetical protein U9P12_09185, partial [Verrucomicrobiota bacterium]|nr:hypothetical protein [Verrucomicrobiota bacterium]